MELLKRAAGIELTHVPYKGGGPAAIGVIAGNVAAMFGGGSVVPLVKSGQLHALAVTGSRRSRARGLSRPYLTSTTSFSVWRIVVPVSSGWN